MIEEEILVVPLESDFSPKPEFKLEGVESDIDLYVFIARQRALEREEVSDLPVIHINVASPNVQVNEELENSINDSVVDHLNNTIEELIHSERSPKASDELLLKPVTEF